MNHKAMTASLLTASAFLVGGVQLAHSQTGVVASDIGVSAPTSITVSAVIRDFRAYGTSGGHADFERFTGEGRVGLLAAQLDSEGKPVLASLTGREIERAAVDSQGRNINPALVNPNQGDNPGSYVDATDAMIDSPESFAQWYRDVPGTNLSRSITMTLERNATTGMYVFNSSTQAPWAASGGFFPVDGELYGNQSSTGHNFGFTTELSTEFRYNAAAHDVFTFSGDDDVWVYVNGQLVIDLGGVHRPQTQTIELDRLGLVDGESYPLKIFHAERHTTGSNFQMETTLVLHRVSAPVTTAMFD
jgi:fibro-slime domain-containing protein